ncbi:MAG: HAD family hydrolase [Marvinbryantia sp.]|jgi:phosphoglycolate phosphatase
MDGIIFDVDGTLWDSTEVVAVAYNRAISELTNLSLRVTADQLKKLFGKPMDVIFAELLPDLPKEQQTALAEASFAQEHIELEKTPGRLYEGVEEMFRTLSEKYPLYIVSNCQCGYIELFLRKTGLGRYIKAHLCFGETGTSKGQTILRLMRENNLQSPVYVGDIQGDADACKEAGIPFVYAEYGFGDVTNPQYRIKTPLELTELF